MKILGSAASKAEIKIDIFYHASAEIIPSAAITPGINSPSDFGRRASVIGRFAGAGATSGGWSAFSTEFFAALAIIGTAAAFAPAIVRPLHAPAITGAATAIDPPTAPIVYDSDAVSPSGADVTKPTGFIIGLSITA